MSTETDISRHATWQERATWGTCPVCGALHGHPCLAEVGLQLGSRMDGRKMVTGEGAHLGRLSNAPVRVKLVEA